MKHKVYEVLYPFVFFKIQRIQIKIKESFSSLLSSAQFSEKRTMLKFRLSVL